ncbi:MAG: LysM peptidoglycan-binding domain-containing protein, partial [Acidimicrobiales bacterium]
MACVAWLAWAGAVISIAEEVVAACRGRGSRRIPIAGAFQPVASRLVAAVLFASLAVARPQPTSTIAARAPLAVSLQMLPAAFTAEIGGALPQQSSVQATPSPTPPAGTSPPVTYTVARHDTLWSIAQIKLGDPLRWREIFTLNEDRPQPDGRALTDPSWIYPGWGLILPADSPATAEAAAPVTGVSVPTRTSPVPSTNPAPSTGPASIGGSRSSDRRVTTTGRPIALPSGSVVAPSFAAGVLAAVAIGRLRRRRHYRPSEPRPGRQQRPPLLAPTLLD